MRKKTVDGDIVASLDNPLFVKGSHKDKTNIIMYDKPAAPSHKINHRSLVEGYINGFGSKVGVYSNHATIIEALKALFKSEDKQKHRDELERRKKLLREVVGAEIDSAKGLAKPKEPVYFTKWLYPEDGDTEEMLNQKRFYNSLVISKKPYFFRYLYPELNKKYKQYENKYNERSRALFGIKLKKVLAKPEKTQEEKLFIQTYHRFSPVINTNCTMNILCRHFEKMDFDIQWGKTNESKLPFYDLNSFKFDIDVLQHFRTMYQKWNTRKAVAYVDSLYSGDDDADYKETKFGILDAIRAELKEEYLKLKLSPMDCLTYIKALSQSYTKFNWGFAWDIVGEDIITCIDTQMTVAPVESLFGAEYLGKKYVLKSIFKNIEIPSLDFINNCDSSDSAELTFDDLNIDDIEDIDDLDIDLSDLDDLGDID